jgi:hypothetical protein
LKKILFRLLRYLLSAWLLCAPGIVVFASSGHPNEIRNIHFENVTPISVDVVWETAHPGTSLVMLARDNEYEIERWAPEKPDPALVTTHRVRVDRLFPDYTYYIYVASADASGALSTAPGPPTPDGKNPLLPMKTAKPNASAPTDFRIYTLGPTEVFAGYDMYFQPQTALVSGPVAHLYVLNQRGYNNGSDGVVKFVDEGRGNPDSISVHFSCAWSNPSGNDSEEQALDTQKNLGYCYNGNNDHLNLSFRLRTTRETVPGKYSLAYTFESNGAKKTATYDFTVLPTPTAPATPQLDKKAIPGLSTWEKQMVDLGEKWCAYRDQQNAQGNWVTAWGWTGDAWFYDGGRSYENIDTYTAAAGHPNHKRWQHCAISLLEPYASYLVANNGAMAGYSMFTSGMGMNYMRTHAQVMRDGIKAIAGGPQRVHVGYVDPFGIRENAYRSNAWMTDEMLGAPRWPLLQRNIDKLMGQLLMIGDGHGGSVHPFMAGLGMEALIHWYELSLAEGHPDYRVLPVMKRALDGLWRDSWVPKYNLFDYDRHALPYNTSTAHSALNNMLSVDYAWYWMQTGDTAQRDRGDLAFQHAFDDPEGISYSGKQFSQLFEFSFDFVRYRKGERTSSVVPENNPYTGPYADTVPPITEKVNCDPNYFPGCKAGSIGSTSATIFWNTYKPATSQVGYGKTASISRGTAIDKTLTLSHTVKLGGLELGTTYHFRVRSVDKAGNEATMHDLTFTTLPQQQAPAAK